MKGYKGDCSRMLDFGIHLLKLVMGVEISARLVRRSGSRGKAENKRKRSAAAEPNKSIFRRPIFILVSILEMLWRFFRSCY